MSHNKNYGLTELNEAIKKIENKNIDKNKLETIKYWVNGSTLTGL